MVHGSRSHQQTTKTVVLVNHFLFAASHRPLSLPYTAQCNQYTRIQCGVGNRVNPRVCVPFSSARPKTLCPYHLGKSVCSLTLGEHRSRRPNLIYLSVFEHVPQAACVAAGLVSFRSALIKAKLGVAFSHIRLYSLIRFACLWNLHRKTSTKRTLLLVCLCLKVCHFSIQFVPSRMGTFFSPHFCNSRAN